MPSVGTATRYDPLYPGASETFNSSGTFNLPPGIHIVNVQLTGATGNSGAAGNDGGNGNDGNPGTAGTGGAAGTAGAAGNDGESDSYGD